MSLSKSNVSRALIVVVLIALAGCQVRPLYSDAVPAAGATTTNAALQSISIKDVESREAQEVRNHLIFALSGGAGEPSGAAYDLDLGVTSQVLSAASYQSAPGNAGQPTAGTVVLTSLYILKDATGKEVASGKRSASASFDRPLQQFAALRAQRDAENRAARELADILKLALAADLAN